MHDQGLTEEISCWYQNKPRMPEVRRGQMLFGMFNVLHRVTKSQLTLLKLFTANVLSLG